MKAAIISVTLGAAVLGAAVPASADTVRLHGATTVMDIVVVPHRDAVQKATGHVLEISGNGTGRGLVDLVDGKADAAMVSEPMDIALAAAAAAGKQLDPAKLQMHEVRKADIVFVVHPSNPVSKLSWEQIRDIHTGKITNWKDVGGKDQAIVVYSDALTGGTRAMVKKVVLENQEYAPAVRSLTAVKRVAEMVSKDAAGIGGVGSNFVDPRDDKILETRKIERPLSFVTVGAPSPAVKQVVQAFRAESAKGGK